MTDATTSLTPTAESAGMRSGVLARKYRPETFAALIGQEATVRMLQNALRQNRVAQALVFSGVRGTGKTTLARIVAKGLNCLSSDAPTATPCGTCQNCLEIAAGNSLDVQEIDAASHTGVDHIRDLIGSVSYCAAGRYKVYILDEVHMLSISAFNALLKTLEEPPAHVRFIFATTEIRKIPATVLSRTQRFSLRRVRAGELAAFLAKVVAAEGASADPSALELVARAGDGSVRDALSMLDQFLSSSLNHLTEDYVREQLGQASSGAVLELFEALMYRDGVGMLKVLDSERDVGTDPLSIVRDLLGICHQLSRHKVLADAPDVDVSEADQALHIDFAAKISMGQLARLWQVLLKGADEVKFAPDPAMALEMLLMRAYYLSDVPTPQQILAQQPESMVATQATLTKPPLISKDLKPVVDSQHPAPVASKPTIPPSPPLIESENSGPLEAHNPVAIRDYARLVEALEESSEGHLGSILRQEGRVLKFSEGELALFLPPEHHARARALAKILEQLSGKVWQVTLLDQLEGDAAKTLAEQAEDKKQALLERVKQDSVMQEVAHLFPGADITRLVSKD
ncbi:MAG: DNA polymerase III subunit gamma/tau [Alphaproteobacteria bacterium]|nr:DNA polymerase III subunit gamma/tau [Alphaproteobacteria bacterium]